MPRVFPHIYDVQRVNTPYSPMNKIRLHASERTSPYEYEVMNAFMEKIQDTDVRLYPNIDMAYEYLEDIANMDKKYLTMYDGSSTGIRHIFQTFGNGKIISADPSFPMYKVYADILDIDYVSCKYDGTSFPYETILDNITGDTAIVVLSNPSTPFGYDLNDDKVREIWMKCVEYDCLLLIDEAYIEFSDNQSYSCLARMDCNIVVLKTLSKGFGSAGVRIGYSVASKRNNMLLRKVRNMNDISSFGIKWMETIIEYRNNFEMYIQEVKANRDALQYALCDNGYTFVVSNSNFINVENFKLSEEFIYKDFNYDGKKYCRFSIPASDNEHRLLMQNIEINNN